MKRRTIFALAGPAAALVLAWFVFGKSAPQHDRRTLRPGDARMPVLGHPIYQAHCAACHGEQLQGQPNWRERGSDGLLPAPPHDASGHTWHHPDETLFRITKFGVAKVAGIKGYATAMPVYNGVLSDEEIVAVLSWIKSQWPADVRAEHDQINQQARSAP
ncbi:MAG: c-type cytochrome [Burkholderiales bacterium]|nr:c-type cytochrome [Burkholderiales bacterium]